MIQQELSEREALIRQIDAINKYENNNSPNLLTIQIGLVATLKKFSHFKGKKEATPLNKLMSAFLLILDNYYRTPSVLVQGSFDYNLLNYIEVLNYRFQELEDKRVKEDSNQ